MVVTVFYSALALILIPYTPPGIGPSQHGEIAQKEALVRALSQPDQGERQKAIDAVVASPTTVLPWLLDWSRCNRRNSWESCASHPPVQVEWIRRDNLYSAMAQIFGRLRVKEAIPFLAREIDVHTFSVGPLGHLPLDTGSPAVRALIEIGKDATPAVLRRFSEVKGCDTDDCKLIRLAIVIVLANVRDSRAKPALAEAAKWPEPVGPIAAYGLRVINPVGKD